MSNVIHIGLPKPKKEEETIEPSPLVMGQLEESLDLLKDRNLSSMIMERAVREGVMDTVHFLRREIKDLLAIARSMEASCHD